MSIPRIKNVSAECDLLRSPPPLPSNHRSGVSIDSFQRFDSVVTLLVSTNDWILAHYDGKNKNRDSDAEKKEANACANEVHNVPPFVARHGKVCEEVSLSTN